MVDDGWSVSPEQVSVVLQNVDIAGEPLGQAVKDAHALAERRSDLIVTGRSILAEAWDDFLEARVLVPGKAITAVSTAAAAVVEGLLAITAGDDAMAATWQSENSGLFERQVQQG